MAHESQQHGRWRPAVGLYVVAALALIYGAARPIYYWSREPEVVRTASGMVVNERGWFDYFVVAVYALTALLLLVRAWRVYQRGRLH